MHRLQIEDAEVMRVAIQQEISRSEESRYDHRLHGLLLVTSGQSCREVARLFGEDASTVQRWVRRFERDGLEGLRDGERPGRPRTIGARQWRKLAVELRATPREFGLEASLWDGPLLSEHLRRRYGIELGGAPVPAIVPADGFSAAQAPTSSGSVGPDQGRDGKKNSVDWQGARTLNCGAWTNATSNSMARACACGCPQRSRIRCCGTHRRASQWPVSAR
jgi:transposase